MRRSCPLALSAQARSGYLSSLKLMENSNVLIPSNQSHIEDIHASTSRSPLCCSLWNHALSYPRPSVLYSPSVCGFSPPGSRLGTSLSISCPGSAHHVRDSRWLARPRRHSSCCRSEMIFVRNMILTLISPARSFYHSKDPHNNHLQILH